MLFIAVITALPTLRTRLRPLGAFLIALAVTSTAGIFIIKHYIRSAFFH